MRLTAPIHNAAMLQPWIGGRQAYLKEVSKGVGPLKKVDWLV